MRRGEVALVAPVRWGASETKLIPAFDPVLGIPGVVDIKQFTDAKFLVPQQLALALYATAPAPTAGLAVQWTISIGNGSTSTEEIFTQPVLDALQQAPLELVRPASTMKVAARLTSMVATPRGVKLVVLISPTSPTWLSVITCTTPMEGS